MSSPSFGQASHSVPAVNRRGFLQTAALATTAAALGTAVHAAEPAVPIIDTHTHFYDPSRPLGVPWPSKGDAVLYRPVLPPEFDKLTQPLGVAGTVVVEASPWLEDNQWLLDLADQHASLLAIVGNLSPELAEFPQQFARFSEHPKYRGFRVTGANLIRGAESPEFLAGLKLLAERDLVLDANGGPDILPAVLKIKQALPKLRVVINHLANPAIDGHEPPKAWRDGMAAVAQCDGVWVKVSAFVEKSGSNGQPAKSDLDFYRPIFDAMWKLWGDQRLMFGSNWPVGDRFAPYHVCLNVATTYFREKGTEAYARFCHQNAQGAYQWPKRS